jgi:hypothetical protein
MDIRSIIEKNDFFDYMHSQMKQDPRFNMVVLDKLLNYIDRYINYYQLSPDTLYDIYTGFMSSYINDVYNFQKTGKYPILGDAPVQTLPRIHYDVVLMFSTLFTGHRFRIMDILSSKSPVQNEALIVGSGSGLEIAMINERINRIIAYDLFISDFCKENLSDVELHETYFTGCADQKYESIYLIELLEHLEDPFDLLQVSANSLRQKGNILLTTATNIPQFDHLYNFDDDGYFERKVGSMGLKIIYKENIPHKMHIDIGAKNTFYILTLN